MEGRIRIVKQRMSSLDSKGEVYDLLDEKVEELHDLSVDLHSLTHIQTSMCWQKARLNWLKEGDANSKFFHGIMSSRRRRNTIELIQVNGNQVEGVQHIIEVVFIYFSADYKSVRVERPEMDGLHFRRLSVVESSGLTRPFTLDEVKQAVWDCDSFKSPRLDGINFGFIEQFWVELKDYFFRFLNEFHRNGKLIKGVNSTFIALIRKVESPQRLNDFRPISMVGCMYKVLAKVLANKLQAIIGSLVLDSQSAFV